MVKRAGITVSCQQGIIRMAARNAEAEFRKSNIWGEVFITVHIARNKKDAGCNGHRRFLCGFHIQNYGIK